MDSDRLEQLRQRHEELEAKLQSPELPQSPEYPKLLKEHGELAELLSMAQQHKLLTGRVTETRLLLESPDPELVLEAKKELIGLESAHDELTKKLTERLHPESEEDQKDAIIEIRAAAGGDEAGLFATELFRMYQRFAQTKGFELELLNHNETSLGGSKELSMISKGRGAFGWLKFEGGVHRVQRIPATEKSGRIHTSTVSVAVLPVVEESDLTIAPQELKIDTFRSGGHGGQSVNTTDSAVRITHLPTGLVVSMQDERSQLKNKEKAMKILRARLFELKNAQSQSATQEKRRSMIGTGDRSEKIRTYNIPQDRVTDHRINLTVHNLADILNGNLTPLLESLRAAARNR